jgi:hypothetical protein
MEQIRLFNQHKHIVTPMGSACHTRLFSQSANTLIVLCSDHLNFNYILCDLLNVGATHYLSVMSTPDLPAENQLRAFARPLLLQDNLILDYLKDIGIVRPTASFDSPSPGPEEYKTRWIQIARTMCGRRGGEHLASSIERVSASLEVAATRSE